MEYIITRNELPIAEELRNLFLQTSWAKERSLNDIRLLLQNTTVFIVMRDTNTEQLIGFGRALSDGVYRALLDDIVVDTVYRKQGLGKRIVKELLDQLLGVEQIFLNTKPDLAAFYNQFGFAKSEVLTMSL
ncbi:GNAT family N-acetyltransferase [Aquimarina rubra]|uniref:GNAT family N-acetyltransferase n=1 Tax=Aquimarina rubra TaxID=1920033 RepID=A0ABW5LFZ4_9FLAO